MTSRELMIRTLNHQPIDRLPRDVWGIPYTYLYRYHEMEELRKVFPMDIDGDSGFIYGKSRYSKGERGRIGQSIDEFGSLWEVLEDGMIGEVKAPIITSMDELEKYQFPWEMIDQADFSGVSKHYEATDKFVLQGSFVRPFERLQFLMGTEELFVNVALEDELFVQLCEKIHQFNVKELELLAQLDVDGISFMDDWGSQNSLLISPEMWRKYFKPMYKEYCDIIHEGGKYAFFHSDGYIEYIYNDLVEIGIDAVNSQLFCMDIEKLAQQYAGKIVFWGEICRQHILPFGTEDDVRDAVRRVKKAMLKNGNTGFIAQLSFENITPLENVLAVYDEFSKL